MQAACEAGDVFQWLEGGAGGARNAADALVALYNVVREPWLVRALLQYHARTGSARALQLLARAPEPHARFALDALLDQLRGERAHRHHALAALAPLLARRPSWLHLLLPPSPVPRELVRAARRERDPAPLLNALLALAALLPAAPALAAAHAGDLAEALTRAAPADLGAAARLQLQLGSRAVFLAAYATHPCTVVEAMRAAGAELAGGAARDQWERTVAALARGVALHPALMTGSRRGEADGGRWTRDQPHDVLAECARLAQPAGGKEEPSPPEPPSPAPDAVPLVCRNSPAPLPGSGAQVAAAAGSLRPGGAGWFPLGERSGAEATPHTPLPEPEPEPEPAVEATPENTPARQAFRFPAADSPAVRPLLTRTPPAGAGDACTARLQRVHADRRAQDSPVPIGVAPPPSAERPEPRHPTAEDREVRELTAGALAAAWRDADAEGTCVAPRGARATARPLTPPRQGSRGPRGSARRAASCGPEGGSERRDAAVQTVDTWPEPYEFLLADWLGAITDDDDKHDKLKPTPKERSTKFSFNEVVEPTERLDRYLADLYTGTGTGTGSESELAEQLALAHAQLMYERWRRDAHAERNRRLLGRCRAVRALQLDNAALHARLAHLTAERDALRDRAAVARPAPPTATPTPTPCPLERELAAERALRLRAEAAWHAAEAGRARDAAELQRTRGESFEAARHVEALARAALAAERRAEHVRRLRCELLLLAEREARLAEAVRGALSESASAEGAADGTERALRAACARAEADAEAASARAEAALARAHDAETLAAARDAVNAELKRGARAQAEESAARVRALRDKYSALQRVVRAAAAAQLQRAARDLRTNCG